jgi:hypothetical protein
MSLVSKLPILKNDCVTLNHFPQLAKAVAALSYDENARIIKKMLAIIKTSHNTTTGTKTLIFNIILNALTASDSDGSLASEYYFNLLPISIPANEDSALLMLQFAMKFRDTLLIQEILDVCDQQDFKMSRKMLELATFAARSLGMNKLMEQLEAEMGLHGFTRRLSE